MRTLIKMALTFSLVATVACSKKDSDSSESSASDKLEIMPAIDLSCGGENCFYKEDTSLALGNGQSFLQTMQLMTWIIVGFPTDESYDQLTAGQKELVPNDGFIGRIKGIREDILAKTKDSGIGCASVPSTGEIKTDDFTITWATPKMKSPKGHAPAGETYQKALTTTVGGLDYRFEFDCDSESMAVASKKGTNTYTVFYYSIKDDVTLAEFDLFDDSAVISETEINLQLMLELSKDKDAQLWMSRTGPKDATNHLGFRYATYKAADDDKVSYFNASAGDSDNDAISYTAWKALDRVKADVVSITGTSNSELSLGCATDWNADDSGRTADAVCEGLELSKAPKSGLSADSNASLAWVDANIADLMKAIFE